MRNFFFFLCLLSVLFSCQSPIPNSDAGETIVERNNEKNNTPFEKELKTQDGKYKIQIRCETGIRLNEHLTFHVKIQTQDGKVAQDVEFSMDAFMKAHNHGMNVKPQITYESDTWIIKGVLLHMIGEWELFFRVGAKGEKQIASTTYEACKQNPLACVSFVDKVEAP